jgi:S1-C subfamily serine protease
MSLFSFSLETGRQKEPLMKSCRSALPGTTLAIFLSLSLANVAVAQAPAEGAEKIYQRVLKSTVWVIAPIGDKMVATGTGSVVDHSRHIVLTNYHVVGKNDQVTVIFPVFQKGKVIPERDFYMKLYVSGAGAKGTVIAKDKKRDLALIRLEALPEGVHALRLAADSPSPGQDVHSVGNPGSSGALWVYTAGKVRQVYHKEWRASMRGEVLECDARVVETQSPTNPGDSGGPLVNNRGELVAVTQGGAKDATLLSLFIDISEVKALLVSKKLMPKPAPVEVTEKPPPTEKPKPADEEKLEKLAASKLKLAKTLAEDGKLDRAKERYAEIVHDYPKTKAAEEAQELLNKLKEK